ncbi:MAG: VCBS repeat-containing protein [Candidatus Omnitrophica bacterium]|nr:VCBS repeat-containing protein [Candidatus Omnitrophota bacterium]
MNVNFSDSSGKLSPHSSSPSAKWHLPVWVIRFTVILVLFFLIQRLWAFLGPPDFDDRVRIETVIAIDKSDESFLGLKEEIGRHSLPVEYKLSESGGFFQIPRGKVMVEKDVDGDGRIDRISLIENSANPILRIETSKKGRINLDLSDSPSLGTSVGFDDIDGDGHEDGWCGDPGDARVRIFWGTGDGRFPQRQNLSLSDYCEGHAFKDMDGDGDLDLLLKKVVKRAHLDNSTEYEWVWAELERI